VIVPTAAFQVTTLFVAEPATVAAKTAVLPAVTEAVAGDTVTDVTPAPGCGFVGAAVTVIVAVPTLVGSATALAVTIEVPAVAGAVKTPPAVMLPFDACHVTALFVVEPSTDATRVKVPPVWVEAEAGEIVTDDTAGSLGGGVGDELGPATVTTAEADFVGSATLVAVTIPVAAFVGAVYMPEALTEPVVAVHVTASLDVAPCTAAVN
jgi:hypothetical protein